MAHVASAIVTTGGVCIFAFLKSATHAACASNDSQQILSNNQSQTITASFVWAAMALVANAAILVFKSRSKQGLALAAAICAKWQPAYFLLVSIERVVFSGVMVARDVKDETAGPCGFSLHQHGQILATELLMPISLLFFSLAAICCDYDPDFTPAMRRGAYFASAACFVSDMICSFVWGFGTRTDRGNLSFGPFRFLLDNQITSCITSQVVVLLHLLYVSCRSREGRGWAYASLRFVLVKQYNMETLLEPSCSPLVRQMSNFNGALEGVQEADVQAQAHSNLFPRLRHRFLRFQRRHLQACQVFAIPCVEGDSNLSTGLTASGLQLARPLFRIKFPGIMARFAELHVSLYFGVLLIVGLVSLACTQLEPTSTATLVLNIIVVYGLLGSLSCKRHNIDSVAAKHVSTSFRFVCICLLLLFEVTLDVHLFYIGQQSPQNVASSIVMIMVFILCLLVDCSPNLPTAVQTAISVRACVIPF